MTPIFQASLSLLVFTDRAIAARQFRIVQLDSPSEGIIGERDFYLLRKRRWFWGYFPVNGRDRGAPGPYNHQLAHSGNPAYHLVYSITEIIDHEHSGTRVPWHGRDRLPKYPIIAELDVPAAWETVRKLYAGGAYPDFGKVVAPAVYQYLHPTKVHPCHHSPVAAAPAPTASRP